MKKFISKSETLIRGKDVFENNKWLLTEENKRISYLTEKILKKIAIGNWTALYLDESDGRYWELFYDESRGSWRNEGSPSLRYISKKEAKKKYNL